MVPGPDNVDARLYALIGVTTLFTFGHQIDHVIRYNHVSWPVAPGMGPFTWSMFLYLFYFLGLYLTLTERVGALYWFVLAIFGWPMLARVHLGPWAAEPPKDVYGPYQNEIVGYLAFGWELAFIAAIAASGIYAGHMWRTNRNTTS